MRQTTAGAAMAVLALVAAALAQSSFSAVGEYSTMRYTDNHAYGYAVQLWRDGESMVGLFMASDGLAGDTPAGRLENVVFRPATGDLIFQARLSMGVVLKQDGSPQPSRERFEFTGKLSQGALVGVLKRYDVLQAGRPPKIERMTFRPLRRPELWTASNATEWDRKASDLLKRRGPKW